MSIVEVQIVVNNVLADFEAIESLPISLRRSTDKFTSIVGADGTTIDNVARSLVLPSTKNNDEIFGSPHIIQVSRKKVLYNLFIVINGITIFNGRARYKTSRRNFSNPLTHNLELLGDGYTVWQQLEGISLRDISMGDQLWTETEVLDSMQQTYKDGQKGIFAPVIYGQTSGNGRVSENDPITEDAICDLSLIEDTTNFQNDSVALEYLVLSDGTQVVFDTQIEISEDVFESNIENEDFLQLQIIDWLNRKNYTYVDVGVGYNATTKIALVQITKTNAPIVAAHFVFREESGLFRKEYPKTTDFLFNNCTDNRAFAYSDFRFQVYHKTIFESIFCDLLKYNIVSDFYNTETFEETVYLYGVGDENLLRSDVTEEYRFVSIKNSQFYSDFNAINISNPEIDLYNELQGTAAFQPIQEDIYTLEFEANADSNVRFFQVALFQPNGDNNEIARIYGSIGSGGLFKFEATVDVKVNTDDFLVVRTVLKIVTSPATGSHTVRIRESQRAYFGSEFQISSILHDKAIKGYLRGKSHCFNLAWYVDNIHRTIYFEPRFDYTINGQRYKGFYTKILSGEIPVLDCQQINLQQINPFGEFLQLAFRTDSSNPIGKKIYDQNLDEIPFAGIKAIFNELQKAGTTERNPFFEDLFLSSFSTIVSSVLPFVYSGTFDSSNILDAPNYKSNPKTALIHRGKASILLEGGTSIEDAPLLAQHLTKVEYNGERIDSTFVLSYADSILQRTSVTDFVVRVKGIGSTFYPDYFSTIRNGVSLQGKFVLSNYSVAIENFRSIKAVKINDNYANFILLSISNFTPLNNTLTDKSLIEYKQSNVLDDFSIKHYALGSVNVGNALNTYTFVDTLNAQCSFKLILAIRLDNQYSIPLNYPYQIGLSGEGARIQRDLINYFDTVGVDYSGIIITIDFQLDIQDTELLFTDVIVGCVYNGQTTPYRLPFSKGGALESCDYNLGFGKNAMMYSLTGIITESGQRLSLAYPYNPFSGSDVNRLETDLINFFDSVSANYDEVDVRNGTVGNQSVTFSINIDQLQYDKLLFIKLEVDGNQQNEFFNTTNCQ